MKQYSTLPKPLYRVFIKREDDKPTGLLTFDQLAKELAKELALDKEDNSSVYATNLQLGHIVGIGISPWYSIPTCEQMILMMNDHFRRLERFRGMWCVAYFAKPFVLTTDPNENMRIAIEDAVLATILAGKDVAKP